MQAIMKDVQILELIPLSFTKKAEGKPDEKIDYFRLVVYEFGSKYPQVKQLKCPKSIASDVEAFLGSRCDINVRLYQKKNSIEYTFEGVVL